ncbi:hypothetical protein ACHAWF_016583 [Thalassiosira exigua]
MGDYAQVSIELTEQQWRWLEEMATKHKLSSSSKALRCCVNCIALGDADLGERGAASESGNAERATKSVELSKEQFVWLESKRKEHGQGVAQTMLQSCMSVEECTVFGVIRCKKSIAQCDGAQSAVKNIREQFCQKEEDVVVKENIDISPKKCGCEQK